MERNAEMGKPIVFIQWLKPSEYSEARAVIREYATRDDEIAFHDVATKAEAVAVLRQHSGDGDCQFLFIGTHGGVNGIGTSSSDLLTWRELWNEICKWRERPVLWLGACRSSLCAAAWTPLPTDKQAVQWIVGFATPIYPKEIKNILGRLVGMTTVSPIVFVDEEIPRLRKEFPSTQAEMFYPAHFDRKNGFLKTDDFMSKLGVTFKVFLQNQR